MSFRSSAAKAMPANSDQSRGPHVTRRTQDGDAGGTAPSKRFRMAAASSASTASHMGAGLTTSDGVADASAMPSSIFSSSRKQQAPPASSSSFSHTGASNNAPSNPDAPQNTGPSGGSSTGARSFLQTRRRHPSTNNAKLPLGPRPIELQNANTRSATLTMNSSYENNSDSAHTPSTDSPVYDPSFHDVNDFSFAAIDPMKTVPQDPQDMEARFSMFQEPTFNFDDFHDNIATNEPSLSHFPLPGGGGSIQVPENPSLPQVEQRKISTHTTIPIPTRKTSGAGGGSLSRKGSSASATNRSYLSKADPLVTATPNSSAALRARRQSHFPPNAFNNANAPVKAPRKSVGPGTFLPPETGEPEIKRRPSVGGRKSSAENGRAGKMAKQPLPLSTEDSKSPRTVKAKSVLLPKRNSSKDLLTPSRTPDPQKTISIIGQTTPGKRSGTPGRTTTPGGSKRMSVMPGHATGLGARTISPTDARRMKRMSVMPTAPPVPRRRISQAPPTPQPEPVTICPTSNTQSPGAQNRKSVTTPSSSRTTPDPKRKSYSSGQSLSSATSYNSTQISAHVIPRTYQSTSSSRLPTPKPRTDTNEDEVPPVPAIPKSYDSPASEIDQPFFSARSSGLQPNDDTPVDFPTAVDIANAMSLLDLPRPPSVSSSRMSHASDQPAYPDQSQANISGLPQSHDQPAYPDQSQADSSKTSERTKKTPANLRLPPMNLLPLSTPTAAKIKSLKESRSENIDIPTTPPGMRSMKTPSTPMTASKATFFPKSTRSEEQNSIRSSTSHYALRHDASLLDDHSPSLPSFDFDPDSLNARGISPFISSSLPKDGNEFGNFMRPNFNTGLKRTTTQQKPNGPRMPSYSVAPKTESSTPVTDKSGAGTPLTAVNTSNQNIQRRRSETKLADLSGNDSEAARYDNMPPPRLPASATWSNLSSKASASPTQKPGFFRTRRKTSASSTNTLDPQDNADSTMTHAAAARPSLEATPASIMTHPNKSGSILGHSSSTSSKPTLRTDSSEDSKTLDKDDLVAEEEMRKLASKRRDLEAAARKLDSLQARAKPVKRISASTALQTINLNIFERGEIVDYPDVYFTGTRSSKKIVGDLSSTSTNFGYDDERGDYNIVEGDHLVYRYEVIDLLGKGSFGQVVRCIDHKTGQLVAIKIIRNKKRFHQQALVEVDILQKLKEWDPQKRHNVVNFDQSFYFRGHLCISTDLLDMNLYEFIKIHDFRGFSLKLIRRFTKQMLGCLVLLHHKRVIHCDLKPENILLAHPAHSDIKVIDFGSSCFENEKVYTYIQSRFYRSPEVILGMSYGMPIDMWSLGCILAELYTGYPIFPGENEQEQLACIMEVFGPPEKHLIEKSTRKKLFFDSMGKPRLTVSSKGKRRRPSSKDLRNVLKCDDEAFLDFIARCLRWDPARRMNPHDALRHEFITGVKLTTSTTRRNVVSSVNSPAKRNTTVLNGSSRPLPQPPTTSGGLRPLTLSTLASSPSKSAPRRQSMAANGGAIQAKRASHAVMTTSGGNNVTRVVVKSTGGRSDLAAAAAAASLIK